MVNRHRQSPCSPGAYRLIVIVLGRTRINQRSRQVDGKLELCQHYLGEIQSIREINDSLQWENLIQPRRLKRVQENTKDELEVQQTAQNVPWLNDEKEYGKFEGGGDKRSKDSFCKKKNNLLFYIGVQPINSTVIVSGAQQRDSATHVYVSTFC